MKNRLIKEILLWGGIFCSQMLLQAQVAGDVANVKFEEVENPVPKQAAVGGNKGILPVVFIMQHIPEVHGEIIIMTGI